MPLTFALRRTGLSALSHVRRERRTLSPRSEQQPAIFAPLLPQTVPRGRGSNSPWSARHVLRERKTLRHVQDRSAAPAGDGVACPFACRPHEATSGEAVQIGASRCRVKDNLGATLVHDAHEIPSKNQRVSTQSQIPRVLCGVAGLPNLELPLISQADAFTYLCWRNVIVSQCHILRRSACTCLTMSAA